MGAVNGKRDLDFHLQSIIYCFKVVWQLSIFYFEIKQLDANKKKNRGKMKKKTKQQETILQ